MAKPLSSEERRYLEEQMERAENDPSNPFHYSQVGKAGGLAYTQSTANDNKDAVNETTADTVHDDKAEPSMFVTEDLYSGLN